MFYETKSSFQIEIIRSIREGKDVIQPILCKTFSNVLYSKESSVTIYYCKCICSRHLIFMLMYIAPITLVYERCTIFNVFILVTPP